MAWTVSSISDLASEIKEALRPTPGIKYELFSVPAFTGGGPELVDGQSVGSTKRRVRPGDLLLCKINPRINRVWLVPEPVDGRPQIASPEYLVLRMRERDAALERWLLWYLRSPRFRSWIEINVEGATGSHTRAKSPGILRQPVPVAPRKRRESIVDDLEQEMSRIEAGRSDILRITRSLDVLRRSVVGAATAGTLVPNEAELGGRYEYAEEYVRRLSSQRAPQGRRENRQSRATPSQRLPAGWVWARLRDLGALDRGRSRHRPRNDKRLYGGPYPFLQTGDIRQSGGTVRRHSQTYSAAGLAQSRLWPVGTLCITIAANIAETAILTYPACFPDSVVGFVSDGEPVLTRYVQVSLQAMKQRLWELAPATAQKNINLATLHAIAIPLPPPAEQARIVAEVDRMMSFADFVESTARVTLARCEVLRTAVLRSAFTPDNRESVA
jgi:type I restriction enzyme S subunit